jgi:hypothetical protein
MPVTIFGGGGSSNTSPQNFRDVPAGSTYDTPAGYMSLMYYHSTLEGTITVEGNIMVGV